MQHEPPLIADSRGSQKAAGDDTAYSVVSPRVSSFILCGTFHWTEKANLLSERERMIAERYAKGETYKEIATALYIAPATVRNHLASIYRKLNVTSKPELISTLTQSGSSDVQAPPPLVTDKPSIAVLPFTNMSGDPEQEYFSDGITEDIITELSRFPELFVIARNSSFTFKSAAIDVREVAAKLNVQFVVEGSVRKAGNRVRVNAQLLDAVGGAHLWADRYDRELEDIFEVQDDVVRAIVGVLPGRIAEAGVQRRRRNPTSNLSAYECLMRGNHVLYRRGDNIKTAIGYYRQAIELDADFAAAHAAIAVAEGNSVWDLSYYDDNPIDRAYEAAKRALELDSGDYRSQAAYGEVLRHLGRHSQSRQHLERAMALNPNSARVLGYWGLLLVYSGDPEGAIDTYHRAVRLDPFSAEYLRREILAEGYYMMREYRKALEVLESMLKLPIFYVHQQMAMCYAQLGDTDACRRSIDKYKESLPASYDERLLFESHLRLCARQEDRDHWREGYRLTGMQV